MAVLKTHSEYECLKGWCRFEVSRASRGRTPRAEARRDASFADPVCSNRHQPYALNIQLEIMSGDTSAGAPGPHISAVHSSECTQLHLPGTP